jgi:hypothetical protein
MLTSHLAAEAYNRLSYYSYYFKSPSYLVESAKGAVLGRLARFGVQRESVHSCICWVCEDRNFHTRVYLFNYWPEAYGLSDVIYELSLHGRDGQKIHSWEVPMRPQETKRVEFQRVLREQGVETPFEGNLVVRTRNLASRRWVQVRANVDYYGNNFVTSVHEQGWLMNYRRRETHSHVPVVDNDRFETSIVLTNCFEYKRDPSEFVSRPRIEVFGPTGEALATTRLAPVSSCGARRLVLGEAIPDLAKMLKGEEGDLRLFSVDPGRVLFFIKDKKTGQCWVDHASVDRTIPARIMSRQMRQICGEGSALTALAVEGKGVHTRYKFFNNLGLSFDYDLRIRLFTAEGEKILDIPNFFQWRRYETKVVYLKDLLDGCHVSDGFTGHIHVSLSENGKRAIYPMSFDVIAELYDGDAAQGVALASSLYNSGVRRKYLFEPPRTRIFSRVLVNEQYGTAVHVINSSTRMDYQQQARPVVTLFDGSGIGSLEAELAIPPHGSVWLDVEEIFPEACKFLDKSGGVGQVRIRDSNARLQAIHILRPRSGGVPAIDHFIGG